jgi:hypothetical protein
MAVTGIVSTQDKNISFNTVHLTLEILSPAPAPIIDILTTCVVLTGPPNMEAVTITSADANWEAKLWMGLIL